MSGAAAVGIFLVVHLLVCLLLCFLQRLGYVRLERGVFPLVVFVPVWGLLCAVLLCRISPAPQTAMDSAYDHSGTLRTLPLPLEEPGSAADTVPLEEALLLDSPAQRRRLMLLLLTDDPARQYALLEQARQNHDTEVVHYAATAMAQVTKQADLQLQQMQQRYQAAPQDTAVQAEYRQLLRQVLENGLVQGHAARLWRQQLETLLRQAWERASDYTCGCQLAEVQLALQEYAQAEQTLAVLTARWPQRETAWLLCLRCAAARRDGAAMQAVLQSMREKQVWLSATGREAVRFWQEERGGIGHETS